MRRVYSKQKAVNEVDAECHRATPEEMECGSRVSVRSSRRRRRICGKSLTRRRGFELHAAIAEEHLYQKPSKAEEASNCRIRL